MPHPITLPLDIRQPADIGILDPSRRAELYHAELTKALRVSIDGSTATLERVVPIGDFDARLAVLRISAPTSADLAGAQLDWVRFAAAQRFDRLDEITVQLSDLISAFTALANMNPTRSRYVIEFLNVALSVCAAVEHQVKHALNVPRPVAFSATIQPMIQTPNHGSYPSGHATEAFFVAHLMTELYAQQFTGPDGPANAIDDFRHRARRLAQRIAHNRTVAGVHFPVDSAAGCMLGDTLAKLVLDHMRNDDTATPVDLEPARVAWQGQAQFDLAEALASDFGDADVSGLTAGNPDLGVLTPTAAPILKTLWQDCVNEMARHPIGAVR